MSFSWSREGRYFNGLCTNNLRADSGNVSGVCEVCVSPVEVGTCEFEWNAADEKWVLKTDDCGAGFDAVEPNTAGTSDGEKRAGACKR